VPVSRRSFLKQTASTLLASSALPGIVSAGAAPTTGTWRHYGGDPAGRRYSALDQINRSNVRQLRVAWTYHTGDQRTRPATTMECTPIVIDDVMYVTSPQLKVCALDAASGKRIWQFDPFEDQTEDKPRGVNRGVTYWASGRDRRVFMTAGSRLIALSADTGKPIPEFGEKGSIDLTQGLGRDIHGMLYDVTTPGVIYKDLLILGSECDEGPEPAAPGHVRAFDVRTGKMVWIFHTIPQPGEFGNDTWEDGSWKTAGAANDWGGMTVDEQRGWVFLATGSATFDFYGGNRRGDDLFANCVIALDAATGKRIWHYQVVHHDLWDRDLPCAPALVALNINGHPVDAVVQVTKFAQLFVLDRETGHPLFPIEERAVPPSDVPGEKASPTQHYVLKPPPYTRQVFTEDQLNDISPEAHAYALKAFKESRRGNTWMPPSLQGTIVFPGFDGGTDWGGGSFDPATGWFYVNSHDEPWILTLVPAEANAGYRYTHTGYNRFVDREGYAAVKPPWGQLTAIDLNEGRIVWQVVLGEHRELTARGVPPTGTQNIGGSLVTAGGLVFIAATQDEKFRAFDKTTGKTLWDAQLEAGGYASPCTYEVNDKQYVVIAAGGGGKPRTRSGDAYVAFALP